MDLYITKNNDLNGDDEKEYAIHNGSIKSIVWNKTHTQILTGSLDCTAKQVDVSNMSNGCKINDQVQRDVKKRKVLVYQRKVQVRLKDPLS